jgi:hypothetical protein
MTEIQDVVDKYMNEATNDKAKADWNKVVDVIRSIDDMKQFRTAQNLVKNFTKKHGKDQNHGMLEAELKLVSRRLRFNPTGH